MQERVLTETAPDLPAISLFNTLTRCIPVLEQNLTDVLLPFEMKAKLVVSARAGGMREFSNVQNFALHFSRQAYVFARASLRVNNPPGTECDR